MEEAIAVKAIGYRFESSMGRFLLHNIHPSKGVYIFYKEKNMAKKDLSTLLMELKSDKEIKISEYSKEDILNAAIYLANSKDLSMYNNDEISKEFYNRYKNNTMINNNRDIVLITKNKINSYTISDINTIKENLNNIHIKRDECEKNNCDTVYINNNQFDKLLSVLVDIKEKLK